jgi:hypothetical protein
MVILDKSAVETAAHVAKSACADWGINPRWRSLPLAQAGFATFRTITLRERFANNRAECGVII